MFLSFPGLIAVLGLLWCVNVIGSFSSDWEAFRETDDTGDRAIQLFVWFITLIAAVVTVGLMVWFFYASLTELESWKRL